MIGSLLEKQLTDKLSPVLEHMGFDLVRLQIQGGNKSQTLQIFLERHDGTNVTVEDCSNASRQLSAILDVEDLMKRRYYLEIGSAGIDRPLTKKEDFKRFIGSMIQCETTLPLNTQRRFKGRIVSTDEENITLSTDQGDVIIPFDLIQKAKKMITDDILKKKRMKT